ncbi:MAG: hypothetical protein ACP5PT_04325 [Brevinematia bacterium]
MRYLFSVLLIMVFSSISFSATVNEIENILMNHQEKGYSFVKKLGDSSWKVNFSTTEWSMDVYVYVSPNKNNPDFDIVYVYTGIATYSDKELSSKLDDLVYALEKNAAPSEWGTFSLYKEKDVWYLDYNVKLRRVYVNEDLLMNAIGWVAGAGSSYKKQF